jgi:GT2 family glycosyltransferase
MPKLVSIVIVNWNGEGWLRACLGSLTNQTYPNFEIVLVDNDSSDDSVALVQNEFANVRVVENKANLGFAVGNNIGIAHARGDLVLLLNSDTWVRTDFLQRLTDFYEANDYDVIAPVEAGYDGSARKNRYVTLIDRLGHPIYQVLQSKSARTSFYLSGACLLFSKEVYEGTKGFDANFFMYFEEIDWFWRLILLDRRFTHVDEVAVYHAGAGSLKARVAYESFLWRNQNTLQMLLKNYRSSTLCWVIPLYVTQNVIELAVFLLVGKPKIAASYVQGWWFNVKHLRRTLQERAWVQIHRRKSDRELMNRMYPWSAKLRHVEVFFREDRRARQTQP